MLKIGSCLKLSQAKSCPGMPLSTPTVHLGVEGGCTTMEPIASHWHSRSYGSPASSGFKLRSLLLSRVLSAEVAKPCVATRQHCRMD